MGKSPSHIYSLEMAHQPNASFPQVKSKKKKKKTLPIRTVSKSVWTSRQGCSGSIQPLRRRRGNTTERENWKVLYPEHQGEQAK